MNYKKWKKLVLYRKIYLINIKQKYDVHYCPKVWKQNKKNFK